MTTTTTAPRHRRRVAAIAVAVASLTFACSGDGDGPLSSVELPELGPGDSTPAESAPPESAPADTAPPETDQPVSEPVETAPVETAPPAETTPDDTDGESGSGVPWVLILGGLVLVAALIAVFARRSRGGPQAASAQQVRLDAILRSGRTMHDSTMLAVLQPHEPAGLQSVWSIAQRELVELEAQSSALAATTADAAALAVLQQLAAAFTGVRQALEANVGLRLSGQGEDQTAVVDASVQTALSRRTQLDAALQQAGYLRL